MNRILSIIAIALFAIACEKEVAFTCRVVESDAVHITQSSVTLEATIHSSDYEAIDQMGFMLARKGSENYDIYPVEKGRMIEVEIDELSPNKIGRAHV